ncbi:MAG: hypothetical protein JWO72_467 [Caulobacteraceae bacterium]|nr:hypothetical protein [Caulobacteraceae bacterium]
MTTDIEGAVALGLVADILEAMDPDVVRSILEKNERKLIEIRASFPVMPQPPPALKIAPVTARLATPDPIFDAFVEGLKAARTSKGA